MLKSSQNAIGVVFPNAYDQMLPEITAVRSMASIPFASRYRLIDFVLSSMANGGIEDIYMLVQNNYNSLMDHIGAGREWDLARKNGGVHMIPPFAEQGLDPYTGRVQAMYGILGYLKRSTAKYVIMTDANIAANFDFESFINAHEASGADLSLAYIEETVPQDVISEDKEPPCHFYSFETDENGRVTDIYTNKRDSDPIKLGMNIYVMDREQLIELIKDAHMRGKSSFEREVLLPNLDKINVNAFKFEGYAARIASLEGYYRSTMELLEDEVVDALFGPRPVYTKIRDDNPTFYIPGSKVENIMAADGCIIEGNVENSVLFRGVKIGKGAVVKNCVLMQDTIVEDGAKLDSVVCDKDVIITAGQELKGTAGLPVFISKGRLV